MTDEITLPVRRTTGDTLEERLTENAYENILPSRYLLCDENGEPKEDVEDIFIRVAKNIAVAEAVHMDDWVSIEHKHLKPDHPRREELIEEVFGEPGAPVIHDSVVLREENAQWVSFDRLIEDEEISQDVKEKLWEWQSRFQEMMERLEFIPNSPTIMNAGGELQQLSACFVLSPGDDIQDIHDKVGDAARIFQSGGGCGYSFSYLRPYGDPVGSTGGIASGPITFMRTYDQMCETIAQGGTRRGAQMGIMRITHPDVPFFIHAKNKDVSLAETLRLNDPDDYTYTSFSEALEEARGLIEDGKVPKHLRNAVEGHLSNFNISVAVTDEFMEAARNDEDFTMINPRTGEPHIATQETLEMYEWFGLGEYVTPGEELAVPAQELLDRMVGGAHENGEPGIIFIDRANEDHSFPVESTPVENFDSEPYEISSTNPCGEQPLMEYEACNLGHINLSTIVDEDAPDWREMKFIDQDQKSPIDEYSLGERVDIFLTRSIDWDELDARIFNGTRFLDNVVTMSAFPIEEIEKTVRDNRKIGLGIMGLAQMYIQMGVEYGSEAGDEIARQVMKHINQESKKVSHELAKDRGSFNNWEDSKYASPVEHGDWIARQTGIGAISEAGFPIRNHNTTTIAPTGTTSMIGNTTGGCEPIYNVAYFKNVTDDIQGDDMLVEFDDYFLNVLEANDIDVEEVKAEAESQMSSNTFDGIESLSAVPDEIGELFVTTGDLTAEQHASVQCALQEGVDSAISKTCNFPNSASEDDVADVLHYLYENGAKGATIYRDGTRSKQVLTTRADNTDFSDDMSQQEAEDMVADLINEFDIELDPDWGSESPHGDFIAIDSDHEWSQDEVDEFMDDMEERDFKPRHPDYVEELSEPAYAEKRERPATLQSETQRIETGYGSLYVTISEDEYGRPFELFTNIGNSGGLESGFTEALAKVISIALRSGTNPEDIASTLQGIKSPKVGWDDGMQVQSIPDGIGVALERWMENREEDAYGESVASVASSASINDDYYSEEEEEEPEEWMEEEELQHPGDEDTNEKTLSGEECPDCNRYMVFRSEGCKTCAKCGWSEC